MVRWALSSPRSAAVLAIAAYVAVRPTPRAPHSPRARLGQCLRVLDGGGD